MEAYVHQVVNNCHEVGIVNDELLIEIVFVMVNIVCTLKQGITESNWTTAIYYAEKEELQVSLNFLAKLYLVFYYTNAWFLEIGFHVVNKENVNFYLLIKRTKTLWNDSSVVCSPLSAYHDQAMLAFNFKIRQNEMRRESALEMEKMRLELYRDLEAEMQQHTKVSFPVCFSVIESELQTKYNVGWLLLNSIIKSRLGSQSKGPRSFRRIGKWNLYLGPWVCCFPLCNHIIL